MKESLPTLIPKDDNTEVWLSNTSDSENVEDEYVGFPDCEFRPSSWMRHWK